MRQSPTGWSGWSGRVGSDREAPPRPRPTHRVNQKSRVPSQRPVGDVRERRRHATCATGRPSERPSSRVRRPSRRAPRRPLLALCGPPSVAHPRCRAGRLTFPPRGSMRGSGATHTGAASVNESRNTSHESRYTGRLDCRFTTHLVDRHNATHCTCRITHALNK